MFLLAAVTVTSRYAMQRYVADQVERVPWDISVYQTADVTLAGKVRDAIASEDGGVAACRAALFPAHDPALHACMPVIDGQQLRSPWLSLLTATDPSLIPPDIRPTGNGAVLVLVGSKAQMGDAFLQAAEPQAFELVVKPQDEKLRGHPSEHKHPLGIITSVGGDRAASSASTPPRSIAGSSSRPARPRSFQSSA